MNIENFFLFIYYFFGFLTSWFIFSNENFVSMLGSQFRFENKEIEYSLLVFIATLFLLMIWSLVVIKFIIDNKNK
jgi:hypothetical protein